jgi:uncharacterized protein (DUF697 family)
MKPLEEVFDPQDKVDADKIVMRHVYWAMGLGAIPIPFVDFAAVSTTQYLMVSKLADHYDVHCEYGHIKNAVGALLGAAGARVLANGAVGGLLKSIPGVGTLFGMASMPLLSGATTYAIGKVFIEHFRTGGNLLNFDAQKLKDFFQEELQAGHRAARGAAENRTRSAKPLAKRRIKSPAGAASASEA